MAHSKLVVLIETIESIGTGVLDDPTRQLSSWWTLGGELVAERDYWKEEQDAKEKSDVKDERNND